VFRSDDNEECWKISSVKNEVPEEDVSLDEPAGHTDSSEDQRYDYNMFVFRTEYIRELHLFMQWKPG
jgi:hypothetical protein